jgi:hypothetical protein
MQAPTSSASHRRDRRACRLTTAACIAVAVVFALPLAIYCRHVGGSLSCSATINHLGANDWRYFSEAWEAARVALVDFHQLPSWNPYHCGGMVLYQEPQTPFPAPLFLLTFFWLPVAVAYKLWLLVHLVVGALGARALMRQRGGNHAEQFLGATLVVASGFYAHRMGGGHPSFTPFLFLPWILWAHRRALAEPRFAVLVAGLLALTVYEGGTYPLPLMLVALGADSLWRLGDARERRALAVSLPVALGLFPLLAAARLVPVLAYLREHPRLVPLDDSLTVAEVFEAWLTRTHEWTFAGHKFVWPEYGNYVGLIPVLLMLAGLAIAVVARGPEARDRRIDAGVLVLLVWCALGNIPGLSLFGLLHLLPIYESLRVPSRFLGPAGLALALVAVSALIQLRRAAAAAELRPALYRGFLVAEGVLGVVIAADLCLAAAPLLEHHDHVVERGRAPRSFALRPGLDYATLPSFPVRGVGTRQCYTPIEWKPATGITEGQAAEARLEPAAAGKLRLTSWTPNALSFAVDLTAPAALVVNQNYETGWRASTGQIGAFRAPGQPLWRPGDPAPPGPQAIGLLAVSLPAGHSDVRLQHRPRGLGAGLAITLLGLLLGAGLLRQGPGARARIAARVRDLVARGPSEADPPTG